MPAAKPGEVWMTDLGLAAKVRPCLILTPQPKGDDLELFTIIAHTTACRGSRWEIPTPKPFLEPEGAFDVQRIATVASAKLERKLGELTREEMQLVLDRLAERVRNVTVLVRCMKHLLAFLVLSLSLLQSLAAIARCRHKPARSIR